MSTVIFAGIVILIIASIVISAVTYSRQQAYKAKQKKLSQLKSRSDEVLGHLRLLLQVDDQYDIIVSLQQQLVRFLKAAYALEPADQLISKNLATQTQNLALYKEGRRANPIECFMSSDSELNNAQLQLGQVSKYLDICRNRNWITVREHDAMNKRLQRLKLDLLLNTHVYQAEKCGQSGDMVMYQLHLKQARDALSKSKSEYPDKNARVKELSDMLNYSKRTNKMYGATEAPEEQTAASEDTPPQEEPNGEQPAS